VHVKRGLVLFAYDVPNRYTWAILLGYLEGNPLINENIDFEATPFHLYFSPDHEDHIAQINLSRYDFVIIAFSLMSKQVPQFMDFMQKYPRYFQQRHPNVLIAIGGAHARARPADFLPYADFIFPDEAELVFEKILITLITASIDEIKQNPPPGVLIPTKSTWIPLKREDLVVIGTRPPYSEKYRVFAPFEISRGCPCHCKYCQTGNFSRGMRHATPGDIIGWIKRGTEIKYDKIWFLSPNAFAYGSPNGIEPNFDAIERLLKGIKAIPKINKIQFGTFPSEVRPEFVTKEIMQLVKPYITNTHLVIGAQNASDRLLNEINRGHTFADVRNAIAVLKDCGMTAEIDFIFGLPGENEADLDENIRFFEEIYRGTIRNVRIHTHTFMPLPGTPLENAPVGTLHPKVLKIIGKLAMKGKAFGEHIAQAGLVKTRFHKRLQDDELPNELKF
jgi:B12-binding domain/radical SAM domain protein